MLDPKGKITTWNSGAERIQGYQAHEIIGQHFSCFYLKEDIENHHPENELKAAHENGHYEEEGWRVRKDGSRFWANVSITTLRDSEGKLIGYGKITRDLTKRKKAEDRLAYMAHYDHLTGLPNRTLCDILLEKAINRAKRNRRYIALFYFDLDSFKNVNEMLGHEAGNLLLKEVAIRITKNLREIDTIARLGGDEFAVILEEMIGISTSAKMAQLIMDVFIQPFNLNGHEIFTSASIGIAIYPTNGEDIMTLTKNADIAMYNAKEKGRHTYQYFTSEFNTQNLSLIALENNLHQALELNEFSVYFQPEIDITNTEISGFEALLRWQNPSLGSVSPEIFMPIAEKLGLVNAIGKWVFETACQQFKQWQTSGLLRSSAKLAVNLSSQQLKQEKLPAMVMETISKLGINPAHIELELTETAIMSDKKNAVILLRQLHDQGIKVAIDDFGTGYSSLTYLKDLPVDILKIDKSFIRDIVSDPHDAMIIKAIIALGHELELKIVAEGVETAEQLAYLQEHKCDYAQGFYYSQALNAEEMTHFLQTKH